MSWGGRSWHQYPDTKSIYIINGQYYFTIYWFSELSKISFKCSGGQKCGSIKVSAFILVNKYTKYKQISVTAWGCLLSCSVCPLFLFLCWIHDLCWPCRNVEGSSTNFGENDWTSYLAKGSGGCTEVFILVIWTIHRCGGKILTQATYCWKKWNLKLTTMETFQWKNRKNFCEVLEDKLSRFQQLL